MPVSRRLTPPPMDIELKNTVMESLNAWTTDHDHEHDESPIKKIPLGYTPLAQTDRSVADTGWRQHFDTESDNFNFVIGLVIIANAVVIGLETDNGSADYIIAEHIFNVIFVVEMLLRIGHIGPDYFTTLSYLFDCSLVVTGTLDLWVLPLFFSDGRGNSSDSDKVGYQFSVMRLLRIQRLLRLLRLLRVLRVIRLFRMFGNLLLMVRAFGKSVQIVSLLSVLVFIMTYPLGIVCTQLIGHKADEFGDEADSVRAWFGTISRSMATLFWVMFGSGWDSLLHVLTRVYSTSLVLFFFAAYMVVAVALVALIVGLISESLIIAQQEFKQRRLDSYVLARKAFAAEYTAELKELLEDDIDPDGAVRISHLQQAVKSDSTLVGRLCESGIQTSLDVLLLLVDSMSKDDTENVNIDHFIEKLVNLSGTSSASAVVDLKYDLLKGRQQAENVIKDAESVKTELVQSRRQMDELSKKLDQISSKLK